VPGTATPPAAPSGSNAAPATTPAAEPPAERTAASQGLFAGLNLDAVPRERRSADLSAPRSEQSAVPDGSVTATAAPVMPSDAGEPKQTAVPPPRLLGLNLDPVPRDQRPADVSAPRGEQQ
jgi:hypothetical protein